MLEVSRISLHELSVEPFLEKTSSREYSPRPCCECLFLCSIEALTFHSQSLRPALPEWTVTHP